MGTFAVYEQGREWNKLLIRIVNLNNMVNLKGFVGIFLRLCAQMSMSHPAF